MSCLVDLISLSVISFIHLCATKLVCATQWLKSGVKGRACVLLAMISFLSLCIAVPWMVSVLSTAERLESTLFYNLVSTPIVCLMHKFSYGFYLEGHRICGLDGRVTAYGGHLELVAIDCNDVKDAGQDDNVLVSCGVVLIHKSESHTGYVCCGRFVYCTSC